MITDIVRLSNERIRLLEERIKLQKGLPHLHGWKFYPWAKEFFESRNKLAFLCAANQISKSSTQLRKVIHWATAVELWPELWKTQPRQFWYLYPTRDVAHIEWSKKIKPEFMPRDEFETHPVYGWKQELYHNRIFAIHFNSGVSVYFKTYAQDVQDLQTGSCHYIALDEEPEEEIMGELLMRLAATDGYLSGVFTPTLGQEYWRQVIEEHGPHERFKEAFKRQISMYDCLYYADGSRSPWTNERIVQLTNFCKSEAEVQRRIHGRFVVDEGLKYPSFSRTRNMKAPRPIPKDWTIRIGVDPGSGGDNHPAAIVFLALSPDYKKGVVFRGWRGDGVVTTISDIVDKVVALSSDLELGDIVIYYDWASRDFFNIASQMGLSVEPADKSHAIGEQIINVLFKNDMLEVYILDELQPLAIELSTLKSRTAKTKAKDDYADALRYAVTKVPWNWESIRGDLILTPVVERALTAKEAQAKELQDRRKFVSSGHDSDVPRDFEEEMAAFNELLEPYGDDY